MLAAIVAYGIYLAVILKNYPGFGLRYIGIAALVFIALAAFYLFPGFRFFHKFMDNRTLNRDIVSLAGVALLSVLIYLLVMKPAYGDYYNPLLLPKHEISVQPAGEWQAGESLVVKEVTNGFSNISLDQLTLAGDWTRTAENHLVLSNPAPGSAIGWQGRAGTFLKVLIEKPKTGGVLNVYLDGKFYQAIQSEQTTDENIELMLTFRDTWYERLTTKTALLLSAVILAPTIWLLLVYAFAGKADHSRKIHWVWYALPALICWTATFLAFYPGIYSPDSTSHLEQAVSGQYNNWHSVLYTLIIQVSMTLTKSAVPVIVAQYALLALACAWLIGKLSAGSSNRWLPWIPSVLIAIAPPANLTAISLWKDVPYTICVITFTGLVLWVVERVQTRSVSNWLILLLTILGSAVILFRENGLIIPFVTLLVLGIVYRSIRWQVLVSCIAIALVVFIFLKPVQTAFKVQDTRKSFMVIAHYLWPYLLADDAMSDEQRAFFAQILPEERWSDYECGTVNSLIFHNGFHQNVMGANQGKSAAYLFNYLRRDLRPAFERTKCASEIIWRIPQQNYLYQAGHDGWKDEWVFDNSVGLKPQPKFEWLLRNFYEPMLREYSQHTYSFLYTIMWRPAVYLYAFILLGLILVYRANNLHYLLVMIPAIVQSVTLILTTIAQDFRYQFPVYLLGIIFIAVLAIPVIDRKKDPSTSQ